MAHRPFRTSSLLGLALLAGALPLHAAKPDTRDRAAIPAQYRWDFSAIYPNWEAWEAALKDMETRMQAFAALKGSLAQGPQAVLKAYREADQIGILEYKVYRFPQLQRDTNTRDQDMSARFQRVTALQARFETMRSWFTPELLTIPRATMEKWIAETPALAPYKFTILDNYRQQAHVLDEKGEKLLSLATPLGQTPVTAFQELSTSDIKFPKVVLSNGKEVTLSHGNYQQVLQTSYQQADRAKAFDAYIRTFSANANTYAAIYNGILQRGWFQAQARNFTGTLDAALDGNAIPPQVVHTLVSTARAGTAPLQRYMKLRKQMLGLDKYHMYDNSIPLLESKTTYDFDQSKDLILASVAPLGKDYVDKYRQWMSGGKLDVYENDGKRSGAYSANVYGIGPYVLMNYNDTLSALFTFAHEAGHAMHSVLSNENQPYVTSDYTIFVAEVASTTNERLLLNKMLEQARDPRERFALLEKAIDRIQGVFYTQSLFADFELQAHRLVEQGKPITADVLSGIYLQLLKDYYGDSVEIDDLYKYTWTRIPHFYNSPYYVYQYATCYASSASLYKDMNSGTPAQRAAATDRYLTLLKSGGNDHPMQQLLKAGVDLTQRQTVQAVVDQMDELVSQLEAEAAKIKR